MKKSLKGICATVMVLSLLTVSLTACGKKIEQKTNPQNGANVNIIQNSTAPVDGGNNGQSDYVDSGEYNNQGGYNVDSGYNNNSSDNSGYSSNDYTPSYNNEDEPTGSYIPDVTEDNSTTSKRFKNPFTKTTTTKGTTTTRVPTSEKVDAEKVLNSAHLNPMLTNDPELDAMVENVLSQTTNSGMSTYQKVRSVYNYLVQTNRYGTTMRINLNTRYYSVYDTDVVSRAEAILRYKTGNCVDFSAAFMAITRRIGLDCYLVTGQILNKYGESSFHGWNIIRINGIDYGFDCEGDFRASGSGKKETTYWLFCVNDPVKFKSSYTKIAVASFGKFKTY